MIMHIWTAGRVGGCGKVRITHRSDLYKGRGDLRMYGHGFTYYLLFICNRVIKKLDQP